MDVAFAVLHCLILKIFGWELCSFVGSVIGWFNSLTCLVARKRMGRVREQKVELGATVIIAATLFAGCGS